MGKDDVYLIKEAFRTQAIDTPGDCIGLDPYEHFRQGWPGLGVPNSQKCYMYDKTFNTSKAQEEKIEAARLAALDNAPSAIIPPILLSQEAGSSRLDSRRHSHQHVSSALGRALDAVAARLGSRRALEREAARNGADDFGLCLGLPTVVVPTSQVAGSSGNTPRTHRSVAGIAAIVTAAGGTALPPILSQAASSAVEPTTEGAKQFS